MDVAHQITQGILQFAIVCLAMCAGINFVSGVVAYHAFKDFRPDVAEQAFHFAFINGVVVAACIAAPVKF